MTAQRLNSVSVSYLLKNSGVKNERCQNFVFLVITSFQVLFRKSMKTVGNDETYAACDCKDSDVDQSSGLSLHQDRGALDQLGALLRKEICWNSNIDCKIYCKDKFQSMFLQNLEEIKVQNSKDQTAYDQYLGYCIDFSSPQCCFLDYEALLLYVVPLKAFGFLPNF